MHQQNKVLSSKPVYCLCLRSVAGDSGLKLWTPVRRFPTMSVADAGVRHVNPERWHQTCTSAPENLFRKLCGLKHKVIEGNGRSYNNDSIS